jgi:hypothetical protein
MLPFWISPLLLLQARKYLIAHNTRTVTIAKTMMGRQKKRETSFPPVINEDGSFLVLFFFFNFLFSILF